MSTHHDLPDDPAEREADLEAWAQELERREAALDTWERSLRAEQTASCHPKAPAAPVAAAIRRLQDDGMFWSDVDECAVGIDVDAGLLRGILDGTIAELDVPEIRAVCEGMHCSPYDMWGTAIGRQMLGVYGPEQWPAHIDPLDDPGVGENVTFITHRLQREFSTPDQEAVPVTGGTVAHLSMRSAVASGQDVDALVEAVLATGMTTDAALVELRQAGSRLQDAATVAVRVAATPAEGIAAIRDVWRVEDVEGLCRLAGCPPSVAEQAAAIGLESSTPAPVASATVPAPVSLIDRWAAVADRRADSDGPMPLPPAS
jgi:hypothetical protein